MPGGLHGCHPQPDDIVRRRKCTDQLPSRLQPPPWNLPVQPGPHSMLAGFSVLPVVHRESGQRVPGSAARLTVRDVAAHVQVVDGRRGQMPIE